MNDYFCKKHSLAHAGPTCQVCDRDATIVAQAARIEKLEAALKWYADEGNYFSDDENKILATPYIASDLMGLKARKALEATCRKD